MAHGKMIEPRDRRATVGRFLRALTLSIVEEGNVEDLALLTDVQAEVAIATHAAVNGLRCKHDYSWADIGRALGITRQSAQERFGG